MITPELAASFDLRVKAAGTNEIQPPENVEHFYA